MPRVSPTFEGFRAAFRRPWLTASEIAWRWTAGGLALTLLLFGFFEYLDTLAVNQVDAALLGSKQPFLVARAIRHILRGSLNRAVLAALLAALALSLLWIIVASIGRDATVRALLEYFRNKFAYNVYSDLRNPSASLRSLIGLNSLRAAAALAAILAFLGGAILAGFASPDSNPQPGMLFMILMSMVAVICMVWPALNWLLSLASIFAVRDGEDALGAVSAAVAFFRERPGAVLAVSAWIGLAHLAALFSASIVASLFLAFIHIAPARLIIAALILVALGYFAVVDWLYIARLAGYICIAEVPDALASSTSWPLRMPPDRAFPPSTSDQTAIDRDELILGDVPNLAVET
jgi:hypothetical protein